MTPPPAPPPDPAPEHLWEAAPLRAGFWFSVLALIYLVDMADRAVIGAAFPAIKQAFHVSDGRLGLLGSALNLALGLLVIPSGLLIDRWSRKGMISLMVGVWSLATWLTGRATAWGSLLGSRMLVGAGEAGYNPAGYALIGAWFPPRLRGRMIGLFNTAQPMGSLIGLGLGGIIAYRYGWRQAFGLLALPGFALAHLILWAPDYRTRQEPERQHPPVLPTLLGLWRAPSLRCIYLSQLSIAFFIGGYTIWAPTLFMRTYHLNLEQASRAMILPLAVAMLGPFLGGWLSDRLMRTRPDGRLLSASLMLAGALPLYLAGLLGALRGMPMAGVIALLTLAQVCFAAHWGAVVTASLELVPPSLRATSQGFLPLFQCLSGAWSATATGLLSDHLGLGTALLFTVTIGILPGIWLLLNARGTQAPDQDALMLWSRGLETGS